MAHPEVGLELTDHRADHEDLGPQGEADEEKGGEEAAEPGTAGRCGQDALSPQATIEIVIAAAFA